MISPEMQEKAKKLAEEQQVSLQEALEIVQVLLQNELENEGLPQEEGFQESQPSFDNPEFPSEGIPEDSSFGEAEQSTEQTDSESTSESPSASPEMSSEESNEPNVQELEEEVFKNEMGRDIAEEEGDEEQAQQYQKQYEMAVANLKQALDYRGQDTPDPNEQKRQQAVPIVYQKYENDPNVSPDDVERAMVAFYDTMGNEASAMAPEDIANALDPFLIDPESAQQNPGQYRSAILQWYRIMKNADGPLNCPKCGKKVSAAGNFKYECEEGHKSRLKLSKLAAPYSPTQTAPSPAPVAPAPAEPTMEPQQQENNQINLSEEEKSRLNTLLYDAAGNGVSPFHLMGIVSGFLNKEEFRGIASSQQEGADFQYGFREGAIARGGNQPLT